VGWAIRKFVKKLTGGRILSAWAVSTPDTGGYRDE